MATVELDLQPTREPGYHAPDAPCIGEIARVHGPIVGIACQVLRRATRGL